MVCARIKRLTDDYYGLEEACNAVQRTTTTSRSKSWKRAYKRHPIPIYVSLSRRVGRKYERGGTCEKLNAPNRHYKVDQRTNARATPY